MAAVNCLMFRPETTADCIDLTWGPAGLEQPSTAETYPPLFHALAGIPALFLSGPSGAYAMRLWLALLCCALFAWAAVLLWTRRPDPVVPGLAVPCRNADGRVHRRDREPVRLRRRLWALVWAARST